HSDEIKSALGSLFDLGIDIIAPTREVLGLTAKMAGHHDLTFYDASFVALAQELKFNLITADKGIWEKTKSLGLVELL
ncbi:MAG: PIN domain-containing protein, partial [Methanobacteriota archaeon]